MSAQSTTSRQDRHLDPRRSGCDRPYSQAVRVGGMLFTSGQVALDPRTGSLVPGGITEQTTQVLENLKAVLARPESTSSTS